MSKLEALIGGLLLVAAIVVLSLVAYRMHGNYEACKAQGGTYARTLTGFACVKEVRP